MTTLNLKTEVQTRIDALVAPVPAAEILQNAVDTVGLDLDLTNITSVLNSATTAIDSNTPADDITALNAASIALGVTSKGGGGIFCAETVVTQTIAAGVTGDLVTIGAAGKITRLTGLYVDNTSASQPGISVDVDGAEVYSPQDLSDATPAGGSGFFVSEMYGHNNLTLHDISSKFLCGEFITVKKDAGNTTQPIKYIYETGILK